MVAHSLGGHVCDTEETEDGHFVEDLMGVNNYGIPGGLSSESTGYISIRRTLQLL
jgi:hypothetical protein